ncbi:MAG: iron-containing alcohol dehydrogenase, partial [Clostridia bacterium]|nr:iron-containing alcohol dehydrogenase [Clostridia bacterium]
NFTLGTDYIKTLHHITNIPLDIHLMVENPEDKLSYFSLREGDRVSVHAESTRHLQKALSTIRTLGAKPMVALNPATPLCFIENVLDDIDGVLIMSVNPGFAGQKLIPAALEKTKALRSMLDSRGYSHIEIEIDGNVSFSNAAAMAEAGANIFVVGTSSIFNPSTTLCEGIKRFRAIINASEYIDTDFLLPIKNQSGICECGKPHVCRSKVYIGCGEIEKISERLFDYASKNVYLIADQITFNIAGSRVLELLQKAGIEVSPYVFDTPRPIPDQENVGLAIMNLPLDCDSVVAVGSGVINDISKIVAATAKLPLITVATAPSMDGYASATSSMEMNGLKISLPSKAPNTVIGDLDILADAPKKMLTAGIGDMLAKYISICEWRIAHLIKGEYYCETVATIMREALKNCVNAADRLLKRDKNAVRAIFEGLVLSGVATEYAGISRPASGVEHYVSHVFDMRGVSFGTTVDMHGTQCGIATLLAVKLYEKLCDYTPSREKAENFVNSFDYPKHCKELAEFIGDGAKYMIEREKSEQKFNPSNHKARFDKIEEHWNEILKIIAEELPSASVLESIMKSIELPLEFSGIGIDSKLVCPAFNFTKDIRDKYVLSHLIWDLGITPEELFSKL